ncbi:MAG: hypothetical protein AVO33_05330 [delta proteobacterium ML8_F1]|nr:MAG: hypothetical protein AVO33_05330 [delta proteobacterium ML8_F1]
MKPKEITTVAILSASLTAGKLALSAVPNIEIVSFLFIVFTVVFGVKRTLLTAVIFTTTEMLIYGFGIWILGYYLIWPTLILLTALLKPHLKSEYGYSIFSGLFGLFFGLYFAVFESFFYGIGYGITYWIQGIPFDLLHGGSNFIVMLVLFKPITRSVLKMKEKT